jgi:hypothetical protein
MPTQKVSFLFNYTSSESRAAGWSETWYFSGTSAQAQSAAQGVAGTRCVLLADKVVIKAFRISQLLDDQSNRSRGISVGINRQGTQVSTQDMPQLALMGAAQIAGNPTVKRFMLRGMPDSWIAGGELTADPVIPFDRFMRSILANSFLTRCVDFTQPLAPVSLIDALGNVTISGALALNPNNTVLLNRVRDINGRSVAGAYVVESVVDGGHFKLRNWPGNVVNASGAVRLRLYKYLPVVDKGWTAEDSRVHKTGRPFGLFRGRRTRRR